MNLSLALASPLFRKSFGHCVLYSSCAIEEIVHVRKQRWCTTAMQEQEGFVRRNHPPSDIVDQAGHGFGRIHWVEKNALALRQQPDRLRRTGRGNAVAAADVVLVRGQVFLAHTGGNAESD